jgi:DNA-directed RNA polymerase specialized sigma24 family protein
MNTRYFESGKAGSGDKNDPLNLLIEKEHAPGEELDVASALSDDSSTGFVYENIEQYLHRIPARERDLIRLYFKDRLKQEQIAKLFGITQAAVSYRLHRGIKRIQFLRTIPELNRSEFYVEIGAKFSEQDTEILWRMYETTCQSEIAKQMGLTQGRVRHRFFRSLNKIKELIREEVREKYVKVAYLIRQGSKNVDLAEAQELLAQAQSELNSASEDLVAAVRASRYGKYWTVFYAISDKHFNYLHEVSLPQFKDRGDAQILPIE